MAAAPDAALLRVEDLRVHFPVRGRDGRRTTLRAVDGVSIAAARGQTLGLVGESGCGKTSLVRAILGLQRAQAGRVLLDGQDLRTLGRAARRRVSPRIQAVFQDPYSALDPHMSIHEIIAEPLRIHQRYDPARVASLLIQVGLDPSVSARRPAAFSGGQRQRIGIARALALDPALLILDEPVSALDVSVQAQVINLLARLQRDLGLTYLFVAHDLAVVRRLSHTVAVMYLGRIIETGSRAAVFDAPAHPYTRRLIASAPKARYEPDRSRARPMSQGDLSDPARRSSGCAFRGRCPRAQAQCAAEPPPLAPVGDAGHLAACWFPGEGRDG